MRGGIYHYDYGAPGYQSNYSYYWSRRLDTTTGGGHLLYFDSNYVRPQYSYSRGHGYSLRCLALASEATKGEPVAAIAGILRVDVAGAEAQAVAIRDMSQPS